MVDELPDPEERREAEALARALEGEPAGDASTEELLQMAELLSAAADHAPLGEAEMARVWEAIDVESAPSRRSRRWIAPFGVVAAAAASLLIVSLQQAAAPDASMAPTMVEMEMEMAASEEAPARDLASPLDALVEAQRASLESEDEDALARRERATAAYREAWIGALADGSLR